MENNTRPINFWSFISQYHIEIPIIQRDYAQGRDEAVIKKKRAKFLEALHSAITSENKTQTLDFVYGDEKNALFQPLDGQQRLTTLFLLYWYIATKESTNDRPLIEEVKGTLAKFTYEIRTSSREFCNKLVLEGCKIKSSKLVSSTIKTESNWWVLGWEKDPTISAMLNMLDDIQGKFTESNLWEKLISDKITFINIPIKNFGLSDDLYVKMNARGKHLTDFENWKAEFERHITINGWENGLDVISTFAHRIDTDWTDLFWRYRDENNRIDLRLMCFIRDVQLINSALTRKDVGKYNDDNLPYYNVTAYNKCDYDFLCDVLSVWDNADLKGLNKYKLHRFDKGLKSVFELLITDNATYNDYVLFLAEYIILKKSIALSSDEAMNWMRVIRNIVHNSTIDSTSTLRGAVMLIEELSGGCDSIYKWLSNNSVKSGFASKQVNEEITKAKLICYQREWQGLIHKCEDSLFCEGRIEFLLKSIVFTDVEMLDFDKFKKVANIAINYFSNFFDSTIKHKLWRVFLTVSDHKFYSCWSSWSYQVQCRKRRIPNDIDELRNYCYNHFNQNKGGEHYAIETVKALLDTDIDNYIEMYICPSDMPKWKQKLIKGKTSFEQCTEGYLCVSDDDKTCWLIDGVRPGNIDKYRSITI